MQVGLSYCCWFRDGDDDGDDDDNDDDDVDDDIDVRNPHHYRRHYCSTLVFIFQSTFINVHHHHHHL